MPINLSNSYLLETAFAPAPPDKDVSAELLVIYGQVKPYYAKDVIRGTISKEEKLTPEEVKSLEIFDQQMNCLKDKILSYTFLKLNDFQKENLLKFSEQFQSRQYYINQPASFYVKIKKDLEIIVVSLNDNMANKQEYENTIDRQEKVRVMQDLLDEIAFCAPGIHGHIQTAKESLASKNTITEWLATFRKNIIKELSSIHCEEKSIPVDESSHPLNTFFLYAKDQGWNIKGYEEATLVEVHQNLAKVGPEDLVLFDKNFFRKYSPDAIINNIADTLIEKISKVFSIIPRDKNSDGSITIENLGELKTIFSGLPIFNNDGVYVIFDGAENVIETLAEDLEEKQQDEIIGHENLEEKKELPLTNASNPPVIFKLGSCLLTLKSLASLKLSLLNHFIKKDQFLFQVDQTQKFSDLQYILVPESPAISYTLEGAVITPWNQVETFDNLDIEKIKTLKLPVYQTLFNKIFPLGKRIFKDFILEGIDFRSIQYLKELDFQNAKLNSVKVSLDQYINLFEEKTLMTVVHDEYEFKHNMDGILKLDNRKKSILLFYAIEFNNLEYITRLLQADLDLSIIKPDADSSKGPTIIEVAANKFNWDCVIAFTKAKKDTANNFRYGSALLDAIQDEESAAAIALINANADLTWVTPDTGNSALHFAALNDDPELIRLLLRSGADAGALNKEKQSAAWLAASNGYWNCVKVFCEEKKDLDDKFQYGVALLFAAKKNKLDLVTILLTAKASLTWSFQGESNTSLHWAVINNNPSMVKILLQNGADASIVNKKSFTAIEVAADKGRWDCVKVFSEYKTDSEDKARYGSALLDAIEEKEFHVAALLIAAGASLTWIKKSTGNKALHLAVLNNHPETVKILLKKDADASKLNEDKKTAIELAAEKHYWDCVKVFAENKKDSKDTLRYGHALLRAADLNEFKVAHDLILAGACLGWTFGTNNNTPLHCAASNNNPELISLLLKNGAKIAALNKDNLTALDIARSKGNWGSVKALLAEEKEVEDKDKYGLILLDAVKANQLSVVKDLIALKASLTCSDPSTNNTVLHCAALTNNPEMITVLLETGVDASKINKNYCTALDIAFEKAHWDCAIVLGVKPAKTRDYNAILLQAAEDNHTAMVALLCGKGFFITQQIKNQTLHIAVLHNNLPMIEGLLKAGAKNSPNKDNMTVVQLAYINKHWDCLQILAQYGNVKADVKTYDLAAYTSMTSRIFQSLIKYHSAGNFESMQDSAMRKTDIAEIIDIVKAHHHDENTLFEVIQKKCNLIKPRGFFGKSKLQDCLREQIEIVRETHRAQSGLLAITVFQNN